MGKGKLVAGIIILIVGVGLFPGGLGLDKLIDRRMDESITTSFLLIRADATPYARSMVLTEITPESLLSLKNFTEQLLPAIINTSIGSNLIKDTIYNLSQYIDIGLAAYMFFNDPTFTIDTDGNHSIQGISEFTGMGNLGFTNNSITLTTSRLWDTPVTGVGFQYYISEYNYVLDFEAENPGNTTARDQMGSRYNSTWVQIESLISYFYNHLFPLVASLGHLPYGNVDPTTVKYYFYMQWNSTSFIPNKWVLYFNTTQISGWEYKRFDLNITQADALWNPADPLSPVNADGIQVWEDSLTNTTIGETLKTHFEINNAILIHLQDYYFQEDKREQVIGLIFGQIRGRSVSEFAYDKFLEQWVTGEVLGFHVNALNPLYIGFELNTTGIDVGVARALWTADTINSLRNVTGIRIWLNLARGSNPSATDLYAELRDQFGLTNDQMDLILNWTLEFREISIDIVYAAQGFPNHPDTMKIYVKTGSFIVGGIVAFVGLMLLIGALKKKR
jgi:hypothetical protein